MENLQPSRNIAGTLIHYSDNISCKKEVGSENLLAEFLNLIVHHDCIPGGVSTGGRREPLQLTWGSLTSQKAQVFCSSMLVQIYGWKNESEQRNLHTQLSFFFRYLFYFLLFLIETTLNSTSFNSTLIQAFCKLWKEMKEKFNICP